MPVTFEITVDDQIVDHFDGASIKCYTDVDVAFLKNEKGLAKLRNVLSKLPHDVDVRVETARKFNSPYSGDMNSQRDRPMFVLTNNVSGFHVTFTPWMVLHRMVHCLEFSSLKENYAQITPTGMRIINDILRAILPELEIIDTGEKFVDYRRNAKEKDLINLNLHNEKHYSVKLDKVLDELLIDLLTMKSARTRILSTHDVATEMFTQYLYTGKVKLNRVDETLNQRVGYLFRENFYYPKYGTELPIADYHHRDDIHYQGYYQRVGDIDDINQIIEEVEERLNSFFSDMWNNIPKDAIMQF